MALIGNYVEKVINNVTSEDTKCNIVNNIKVNVVTLNEL